MNDGATNAQGQIQSSTPIDGTISRAPHHCCASIRYSKEKLMRVQVYWSFAFALLFAAMSATAQTSIDRTFTTTSNDCDDVEWSEEMLSTYPDIGEACQSVEERDGKKFVKFEGIVRQNRDRGTSVDVDFKDGSRVNLTPPEGTQIYMNGRSTSVASLRRGDQLTFYVPEDRVIAHFFAEEPTSARPAQVVTVPMAPAQVGEERERMAASLPSTASGMPLIALFGMLTLAVGVGLTVVRLRQG
jgi:hypothetical protein